MKKIEKNNEIFESLKDYSEGFFYLFPPISLKVIEPTDAKLTRIITGVQNRVVSQTVLLDNWSNRQFKNFWAWLGCSPFSILSQFSVFKYRADLLIGRNLYDKKELFVVFPEFFWKFGLENTLGMTQALKLASWLENYFLDEFSRISKSDIKLVLNSRVSSILINNSDLQRPSPT